MRSKAILIDETKKNMMAKAEKMEIMKSKLKRRAQEAQNIINKAL